MKGSNSYYHKYKKHIYCYTKITLQVKKHQELFVIDLDSDNQWLSLKSSIIMSKYEEWTVF